MKDYIVRVEQYENIFGHEPVLSERTIDRSEDYVDGLVKGLQLAYPKCRVVKEEIPKL